MKYGMSYRGSKSSLAEEIIAQLPKAEVLIDAFGGGGAITHAAVLSGKYKKVIYNEPAKGVNQLFKDAVDGKYAAENTWYSKNDFMSLKEDNAYVRLCWSFGNNGRGYIFGEAIEEFKHGIWNYVYLNDSSLLKQLGHPVFELSSTTTKTRRLELCNYYEKLYAPKTIQLESALCLERLQKLHNLRNADRIMYTQLDFSEIEIPENAVIYCDPPYKDSTEDNYTGTFEKNSFDFNRFYDWAKIQKNIYISEYTMPEEFTPIWCKQKAVRSTIKTGLIKTEKLFIPISNEGDYKQ